MAEVVRGEQGAARSFVRAIAAPVRRAVVMVLGSSDVDVDDATQEAILGVLHALPRFRAECTSTQFAVRIGVLTAVAIRRRERNRHRWVANEATEIERVGADQRSPLADVETARRREAVRRLLDQLPPAIAEAVVLYFMLGYTVPEVAALCQAPVNTVWSRLRIGRERMRQALHRDPNLKAALGAAVEELG